MNKLTLPVFCTILALTTASASADSRTDTGAFVDLSAGGAATAIDSIDAREVGDNKGDGAIKISAGYWVSKHWGVSASYVDHGTFEQKYDTGTFKGSASSAAVSALGRLPFGEKWTLIGKINLTQAEMKDNGSTGGDGEFKKLIGKKSSVILPGVEINYQVSDRTSVFLEADPRGEAADELSIGYVGLGVRMKF